MRKEPALERDFWTRTTPGGDCLLWTGYRFPDGYGGVRRSGKLLKAHRVAFEYAIGPIPAGLLVCHRCDVRHCVSPDHLFLGTHGDNSRDMVRKGRSASGDRNASRLYPGIRPSGDLNPARLHPERLRPRRGEANTAAKLSTGDVIAIRRRRAGGEPLAILAREYGVAVSTISRVANGVRWSHLA